MTDVQNWPGSILPASLKLRVISSRIPGGLTQASVAFDNFEPGGRFAVDLAFNHLKSEVASRQFGALLDELDAGQVFRLTIGAHVETASSEDLGTEDQGAIPYAGGATHSDGTGFSFVPRGQVAAAALEGAETLLIDMGAYGRALKKGHLTGFGEWYVNRVRSISWSGDVATCALRIPLQCDLAEGDFVRLQKMRLLVQADRSSLSGFRALHDYGFMTKPGNITLMEYRP